MNFTKRNLLIGALRVADLLLLGFAFLLAVFVASAPSDLHAFGQVLAMRISVTNAMIAVGVGLAWHVVLRGMGLYRSHRLTRYRDEVAMVVKAVSVCTVVLLVGNILYPMAIVSLKFLNAFWVSALVLVGALRLAFLLSLRLLRRGGRNLRHVVIVGTTRQARQRARLLAGSPLLGYRVSGFVDEQWHGDRSPEQMGLPPLVCTFEGFAEYLRGNVVDEVLVCLSMKTHAAQIADVIHAAEEQGVVVRIVGDLFDLRVARAQVEDVHGEPVLTLYAGGMHRPAVVVKEMMDFVMALVLTVLLSPILLLAALAIKLTSRGPVFFVQERLGLNKRRFRMLKFRTMVMDAEERLEELKHLNQQSGPVFKIPNDPRVTVVGRILRKLSIDELPQLFNVLRGEMSLVGPRPLPVRDYEGFDTDWHRRRFSVRPGMTCTWQVSGRNKVDFRRWMEMDMEYIDNWSLGLDARILLRTIPVVLIGLGAS
jgi:exopolysaccharide biosynthesis polyprenyl glycosylphosphotransferase